MNISESVLRKILGEFEIEVSKFLPVQKGYRNTCFPFISQNEEIFNLIFFKNEKNILHKIRQADLVSNFLYEKNFPTRKRRGSFFKIKSKEKTLYGGLYNYLPGETIPWESYTSKHIKLLGGKMGEMHSLSKKLEVKSKKFSSEINIQIDNINLMHEYFSNKSIIEALSKKLDLRLNFDLEKFRKLFHYIKTDSDFDNQVLHMDFVRGNILFDKSNNELKISGVIDFEKVSVGPRILDISRTIAFLIIDSASFDKKKLLKYFLFNGYKKRGGNSLPDLRLLNYIIDYFLIYDFYKFLKHNPYEFLSLNEHFVRTIRKLECSKLLSFAKNYKKSVRLRYVRKLEKTFSQTK